jgi:hypothetical protein
MSEYVHFSAPFPWSQDDWRRLIELFKTEENLRVTWWWEPFHRIGYRALRHAAATKMDNAQLESCLQNLSCVTPPKSDERRLEKSGLLDEEGRVKNLNPEVQIRRTLKAAGGEAAKLSEIPTRLPTIQDLRKELAGYYESWMPATPDLEEYSTVSNWLTKSPGLMKRFHNLGKWEQLELVESLVGPLISSSEVNFIRVYLKS